MNCPVCNKLLKKINKDNQMVEICLECGGAWFEKGELYQGIKALIAAGKVEGQTIEQAYRGGKISKKRRKQSDRKCPRCNIDMATFNFSYDSGVFLDKCPFCQGIWTDRGETHSAAEYVKGNPTLASFGQALVEAENQFNKKQNIKGKRIALGIGILYLSFAFYLGQAGDWLRVLGFLIIPLACILFADKMGGYTGLFPIPSITKPTPGPFVAFFGWLLLLLPLFLGFWRLLFG